ncbi:MAG: Gfo/Idh/MocA family oxidoreductase [Phycisphaerae bacterium]
MSNVLTIGVVGAGNWGRNVLRNFASAKRVRVKHICDLDEGLLDSLKTSYPGVQTGPDLKVVLRDPEVQAVVIATDAPSHVALARAALTAERHVFVEKPLALSSRDARELVELAARVHRKLMVGHLLEHHPAVQAIGEMIRTGVLGDVYYMYTQRINLGVVRSNENAWWSLAPHDISVVCRLFDATPTEVTAQGQCYLRDGVEDVAFATLRFADGRLAHIHVSWLDPHKIRKMTIVGTKKMVTFDDMSANEKIRIYDKGAEVSQDLRDFADVVSLRVGDIVIPRSPGGEPLAAEVRHFVEAVLDDKPVLTDGHDGWRVVRVLEAGQRSLADGGRPAPVE